MLNAISQTQKSTYYMVPFIWQSGKDKPMEIENISMISRG